MLFNDLCIFLIDWKKTTKLEIYLTVKFKFKGKLYSNLTWTTSHKGPTFKQILSCPNLIGTGRFIKLTKIV
jgi:hypothetical protein